MTTRTSNKQILDAILGLTEAITASNTQNAAPQAHVEPPVVTPLGTVAKAEAPERSTAQTAIKVGNGKDDDVTPAYFNYVKDTKVQGKANDTGEAYMFYARRNLKGECKLAYCMASRWSSLKDKGLIGPIEVIEPK